MTPLNFTGPIRLDNALAVAGPAGLAPSTVDADFRNPLVQSWNVNVQREISKNLGSWSATSDRRATTCVCLAT